MSKTGMNIARMIAGAISQMRDAEIKREDGRQTVLLNKEQRAGIEYYSKEIMEAPKQELLALEERAQALQEKIHDEIQALLAQHAPEMESLQEQMLVASPAFENAKKTFWNQIGELAGVDFSDKSASYDPELGTLSWTDEGEDLAGATFQDLGNGVQVRVMDMGTFTLGDEDDQDGDDPEGDEE